MSKKDQIYDTKKNEIVDFAFNEQVVAVFPDMIRRSIPGYETIIPLCALLATNHLRKLGTNQHIVYDLGCSLGASSAALLSQFPDESLSIVAVDNSEAMIAEATRLNPDPRLKFLQADVLDLEMKNVSIVIANFLFQFIPRQQREDLLTNIRAALNPDGLLIISEKIFSPKQEDQHLFDKTHLDYKRANGYSDLEINQKKEALEKVMLIDSEEVHMARLHKAGFHKITKWFQCLNWASYLVQIEN